MGQLMLICKYIIDTSSILTQKPNEIHRRKVHKSLWDNIDKYINDGIIVTCSEVEDEIKDDDLRQWLHSLQCTILPIDDEIQENVIKIVNEHPKMIEFTGGTGSSSGDAFVIATAMKYSLAVITEENKNKKNKIPEICRSYGIDVMNITELCEKEEWVF
ncbi:MAG: DUF4411 family protein [Ruminococcus sp.]|nr:DUF4411 family protein [Ruminococcus sp.]